MLLTSFRRISRLLRHKCLTEGRHYMRGHCRVCSIQARRPCRPISQIFGLSVDVAHMIYRTPKVFCRMSSTDKGSWPLAKGLDRIVSLDSLGRPFFRVWFRAPRLFVVVISLRMRSSERESGAMAVRECQLCSATFCGADAVNDDPVV